MKISIKSSKIYEEKNYKTRLSNTKGITLIALVVTLIVPYDKMKECCNM